MKLNKKGFTLAEMLIVVIIVSGLMMLVVPNLGNTKDKTDGKTCDAYINLVDSQIQAYYVDKGSYPLLISDLVSDQYIKKAECPDGTKLRIDEKHKTVKDPSQ